LIVKRFDVNHDGLISWIEFQSKFQPNSNDLRLDDRSKYKVAKLREFMYKFMISPKDAFSYVSNSCKLSLTLKERAS
jgi:hypothetical protein